MDYDKLLKRMISNDPVRNVAATRRDVLKGIGATGAVMGAAGGLGMGLGSRSAAAARELRMLTWDGYVDPRVLDSYTAQTGNQVKYELHTSDPDSVNKLRAGETEIWDVINLNNPWAREMMWPEGLINELPRDRFEPYFDDMLPMFKSPYHWAMSVDQEHLLGVCQRVDTFDFVVNTDVISAAEATKTGWDIFLDPAMEGRYGILAYDNWNIMHMCMISGLHPFKVKTDAEVEKFAATAQKLINGAKIISDDFVQLNLAALNGEIGAYFSGGTYTVSGARLDGESNLYHVAPESGPADGKGAILWIELNSAVNNPNPHPEVMDWFEYILQPEASYYVATAGGFLLPVGQMSQPKLLAKFSKEELNAFQWDEFDLRASRAVEYDVVPDYNKLYDIYTSALRSKS
jgi:spermidine/putrescine transport system substrate-binding protein